jgi:TorA maturation chaperone TorD
MSEAAGAAAEQRSQVYALLATVFRCPLDGAQLERLRTPSLLGAMAEAGIDPGDDFATSDANILLDRLAIDYTQLFHAPADRIIPYEGLQTGESDRLMGAAAQSVRDFLAQAGFVVLPEGGELPDHISVELTFMSELAHREAEAAGAGDRATAEQAALLQRRFLAEHLGRWAGRFARDVKDAATTPFYRSMAALLEDFVAAEQADLVPA